MTGTTLIYIAGVEWDDVAGTDHRLATALSHTVDVLWVDPPVTATRYARQLRHGVRPSIGMSPVGPGLSRLRVLTIPGTSRLLLRDLAAAHVTWRIVQAARSAPGPLATIVANPESTFPRRLGGKRLFFVTDDWLDGARMMGVSPRRVAKRVARNMRDADVTAAVTAELARTIRAVSGDSPVALLPNGCSPSNSTDPRRYARPPDLPPGPLVGLVGQINERLDLQIVTAVADAGATTVVIGPRTEREASTSRALDTLFAHPNVHWLGRKEHTALPAYLAALQVGITPYIDSSFNRASFPLKTLEYLAAGLPVVSTDLPAVRWLDTEHIRIADSASSFARFTAELAASPTDPPAIASRINFARLHSWDERARSLLRLLEQAPGPCRRGR